MPRKNYREWYTNLSPSEKQRIAERQRRWQEANPDKVKAAAKRHYQRLKAQGKAPRTDPKYSELAKRRKIQYVRDRKIEIGECRDCGLPCDEFTVVCFAFDHLDPTIKSFSLSRAHQKTYEQIDQEIAKCELVCHNCHALRTWLTQAHRHYNDRIIDNPTIVQPELWSDDGQ